EYGATVFFQNGAFGFGRHPFRAPALPLDEVRDPTGAETHSPAVFCVTSLPRESSALRSSSVPCSTAASWEASPWSALELSACSHSPGRKLMPASSYFAR